MTSEQLTVFALAFCLSAVVVAPLLVRIVRSFRQHREEERATLLRAYPELAEIIEISSRL